MTTISEVSQQVVFDETSIVWMNDPATATDELIEAIRLAHEVVYDLETTGINDHDRRGASVVMASFTLKMAGDEYQEYGDPTWIMPLDHPESAYLGCWREHFTRVAAAMKDMGTPLVGHNLKFDVRWTATHTGVDLSPEMAWDTMLAGSLLDENTSHRLKDMVPDQFPGVAAWDDFSLSAFAAARGIALFDLGAYAARDTYWTGRLADRQREVMWLHVPVEIEPQAPDEVEAARLGDLMHHLTMPSVQVLTRAEIAGLPLDEVWTADERRRLWDQRDNLTLSLSKRYVLGAYKPSDASFAPTSNYFRAWSEEACRRGDLQVIEMTPTGKPRWSKEVLEHVARAHASEDYPVARKLLDLRQAAKKAEFLTSWLDQVSEDGRIHASYNVGRTVTGRLSSSSPNMQQVTKVLKQAYVPSSGCYLAEIDFSQIELRVAAYIARCEPMLEAYQQGRDLHRIMAATITGKQPEEVSAVERQAGKAANFGLLFGMGPAGFRIYADNGYGVTFTMDEATRIYHRFFETWDGIAQWHARCIERAHHTGQIASPIGRVRRIPEIHSHNEEKVAGGERVAINTAVQGFASDLMQLGIASIGGSLSGRKAVRDARVVGTVHDSVLVEVPQDDWRQVVQSCIERMVTVGDDLQRLFGVSLDVPIGAEATVGTRWGLNDVDVIESTGSATV